MSTGEASSGHSMRTFKSLCVLMIAFGTCPHCQKPISDSLITAYSGRIGGKKTAKCGPAYFRKIAAMRKTRGAVGRKRPKLLNSMRTFIVAALFIAFTFPTSPPANGSKQQHPTTEKKKSATQPPTRPLVIDNQNRPDKETNSTAGQTKNGPDKPPWWDVAWSTWALVVVGGLGVFSALLTLRILRKQTNALMNADRSLVLILWENNIHAVKSRDTMSICFNWHFKNAGKSPIFIQNIYARLIPIKDLKEIPRKPVYRRSEEVSYTMEPLLAEGQFGPLGTFVESDRSYDELNADVVAGRCLLYAYGFVRYLDVHRRRHETRFGIVYNAVTPRLYTSDRWKLAGPKAYNRYT